MEAQKNLSRVEVLEIGKDFIVKPRFADVIITCNTDVADGQITFSDNTLSEFQYVVAKGPHVNDLEVGDRVQLDLDRMTVKVENPNNSHEPLEQIKINPIFVDGMMYHRGSDKIIVAIYEYTDNE